MFPTVKRELAAICLVGRLLRMLFVVRYLDSEDLIHEARCWTGGFKRGVIWSWDEIISHEDAA